jgi:hypothetical protein
VVLIVQALALLARMKKAKSEGNDQV